MTLTRDALDATGVDEHVLQLHGRQLLPVPILVSLVPLVVGKHAWPRRTDLSHTGECIQHHRAIHSQTLEHQHILEVVQVNGLKVPACRHILRLAAPRLTNRMRRSPGFARRRARQGAFRSHQVAQAALPNLAIRAARSRTTLQ